MDHLAVRHIPDVNRRVERTARRDQAFAVARVYHLADAALLTRQAFDLTALGAVPDVNRAIAPTHRDDMLAVRRKRHAPNGVVMSANEARLVLADLKQTNPAIL